MFFNDEKIGTNVSHWGTLGYRHTDIIPIRYPFEEIINFIFCWFFHQIAAKNQLMMYHNHFHSLLHRQKMVNFEKKWLKIAKIGIKRLFSVMWCLLSYLRGQKRLFWCKGLVHFTRKCIFPLKNPNKRPIWPILDHRGRHK